MSSTALIFVIVLSVILVFVITRMFWLWFFQIQERTTLMHEQNELLKEILIALKR